MKKSEKQAKEILDDLNYYDPGSTYYEDGVKRIAAMIEAAYPDDLQTQLAEAKTDRDECAAGLIDSHKTVMELVKLLADARDVLQETIDKHFIYAGHSLKIKASITAIDKALGKEKQ